jgi:FtsP/CotA-like multicopper oxidase with cupredoxin domain
MATRRKFLAYTGATTLTLYGYDRFGVKQAYAANIPGGTLDPGAVNKFVTPLLVPPVMPMSGRITQTGGKNIDYYEISVKQFQQQILPAGLPATTVWGYGAISSMSKGGLLLHNAPSLTIEAQYDRPVRIKWINDLKDAAGNYRPHLLPVDQTLHWANPPGGVDGRDTRPTFTATPGPYTGPVPIVTHVHGAVGVGDESDGYAEAWYLPAAANIPAGYATQGTWYDFFRQKTAGKFGATWGAGFATFQYPNLGRAAQDWYHDHTLGMTRLNVYAGPAGFYLLRGGPQGESAVNDLRSGAIAVLPGPAPNVNDKFPPNKSYYEIPIAVQDRSFNADGSLFYPDTRAFFDGITGPYIPETDISPIWNPEFFGNMIMVNGSTWPFLTVETRRYRLRFLNGCQARFLMLDFSRVPGVEVWQIGNDGGFLAAPVNLTAAHENRVLMSPAERADLIVDFTSVPLGNYVLGNVGPDEPYGGGDPGVDFSPADPSTTGQVLQFRVVPALAADLTTPPQFLTLPPLPQLPAASVTRKLALIEEMSMYFEDAPAEAVLGTVSEAGALTPLVWMAPVTENPAVGAVEIWELYNTTGDAHPIHVHEVKFQLVNRQPITVDETARTVNVNGPVRNPEPWESGFKDTIISYPGEVTRIRAQFVNPGQFVWHCHIVEHEDNEMMRPYRIGPVQPGEPGTMINSLATQAPSTWRLLRRRHGRR